MDEDLKKCPFCAEDIKAEAIVCRFCGKDLNSPSGQPARKPPRVKSTGEKIATALGWGLLIIILLFTVPGLIIELSKVESQPAVHQRTEALPSPPRVQLADDSQSTQVMRTNPRREPRADSDDGAFDFNKDVVSNVTYEEIYEKFIDTRSPLTDLQKEQAWPEYKGKWVQWSGIVNNVDDGWLSGRVVSVDMGTAPITGTDVRLYVTDASKGYSSQLSKGQTISFIGKLGIQPGALLGMALRSVTLQEPSPRQADKESHSSSTTFAIKGKVVASKDIATHRRIWQAGMRYRVDGGRRFRSVVRSASRKGDVLFLNPGVEVTLTGRATAIVSEVTLQGQEGTWWIPNKALKEANIPIPPTDVSVLHEH